jgi:hypothetical protein
MKASKELIEFVEYLRGQAHMCAGSAFSSQGLHFVQPGPLAKLLAGCRLLVKKLGPFGAVYDEMLKCPDDDHSFSSFQEVSAVLDSIAEALAQGQLSTVDELASAEVLGDLLEHAEELLNAKYNLAAAIILRAVLEERLRKLCESHGCVPAAPRPTMENFKQALQSAGVIDKIVVKDIDWMAGVGNAAAHNLSEFKPDDVPQLYDRVTAFMSRFSVT